MWTLIFLCIVLATQDASATGAEKLRAYYTETAYTEAATEQPSCRYNCGYDMGSCSCTSHCEYYGNCCYDYSSHCQTTTGESATAQPSCRYNCGSHLGSCSCSSSCQYYGNCCYDYSSYCQTTTGEPATAQPSCRYNCGSHLGSCSCSSSCQYYGNCCYDYSWQCSSTAESPATTQSSCQYNCGSYQGSCSCSSSCEYHGNCCDDYYSYCSSTTDQQATDVTVGPCGGDFYNSSDTFYSPNYPNHYHNNANCIWYIRPSRGIVQLEFSNVDIECSYDNIRVYDGSSTGSRLLGTYCSSRNTIFYSTGRHLTVHFTSDGIVTFSGFSAYYRVVDEGSCQHNCDYQVGNCSCSSWCRDRGDCCWDYEAYCQTTTGEPTTAQPSCRYNCGSHLGSCSCSSSCQYYGNCCYDYYDHCYTTHSPVTAEQSCRDMCGSYPGGCSCYSDCEYYGSCCHDYYNYCQTAPAHTTAQPTCRYNCGSHQGSCSCYSSCEHYGNCCHDYYSYCAASTPSPSGPCGGSLFGSGTFSSPNYPSYYYDNSYCVWQLRASHDQRIYLALTFLQLENCCSCDHISVYDGPSIHSPQLGRVCNNNTSLSAFFSTSNYMTVVFQTDGSVVARGFTAEFLSSLKPNSGRVDCSSDSMHIVLDRSYLNSLGYDGHSLYLRDPYCRPQISYYNVVFSFPLNTCGNVRDVMNDRIVYTNNIYAYSSINGEITRQSQFKMNVTCIMEQDSISQIMFVADTGLNTTITGSGRYNTSMDFYTSSSFYNKVTQVPYEVSVNENLPYFLVKDGCPVDSTYYSISSGSQPLARFSFKAFQFLRATDEVYIQCKVLICPASDYNSRCRRGCRRRNKRSLGSNHDSHTLVVGPIKLKGQFAKMTSSVNVNREHSLPNE
uniref:CUB and zona pellucida-like domains 1, tandem duplicate 2 n=1 Tax=Oryzias latipes TaxID=8090 RepID=H2LLT4_ORYLA